jgi:endonuclease III
VKQDSTDPKKLTALLKRLKSNYETTEASRLEPIPQLLMSYLQWEATHKQAEQAYQKLMGAMVDINELRVSFASELISIIGKDYPLAEQRVARLRETLNELYVREHDVAMTSILSKPKKDQRSYLESLPGIPPYVTAQVMLLSFAGHAMPVDHKLAGKLAAEGVVAADSDPQQIESFLSRQIKAGEAVGVHLLLQAWCDDSKAESRAKAGAKVTKKTTKKTTKRAKKK